MAIDVERLKEAEMKFGGMFRDIRTKNSPNDPEPGRGDRGCDRMVYQNYAPLYARVLPEMRKPCIVEMGIFKGTGLAMWSELYPEADIIGLDIDVDRYEIHKPILVGQGAFRAGLPKVLCFDEFCRESWNELAFHLPEGSVDVWIDDAVHRTNVILDAWMMAEKFMAPRSVYIIEDNDSIPKIMTERYAGVDGYEVFTEGRLTAICKLP